MKLGVIGCGAMGKAIVAGALEKGFLSADQLTVSELNQSGVKDFANQHGFALTSDNNLAVANSDVVLLAVKPQYQSEVLKEISASISPTTTVVSIAAGRTLAQIAAELPEGIGIIRVMPNVNAQVGASMSGLCRNEQVSDSHFEYVLSLFSAIGKTTLVDESLFSVYSALAGCAPAWMYHFVDCLAQAGVKAGLPKAQAVEIVSQTMLGSAINLLEQGAKGVNPQALVDQVCSPAGTTVAGLMAMQDSGFALSIHAAVAAAIQRDQELAGK